MGVEEFLQQVLEAARSHAWIKRTDIQRGRQRVKIRLWINDTFVDVYFNAEKQIVSYAYIEGEERLFGANNMHVGWHVHPFGQEEKHDPSEPIAIGEFLTSLEKELRARGKILD
jgi:hypothetical protein